MVSMHSEDYELHADRNPGYPPTHEKGWSVPPDAHQG
jgi:hypothetical protein